MLKYEIMEAEGIVVAEPTASLSADDFCGLSSAVDAYLADHAAVNGLLVHAEKFPGWDTFAGLTAHIKFVREHHQKIKRVALVTDSALGTVVPALAKHFVAAEVKHFAYADYEKALAWLSARLSESGDACPSSAKD